MKYILTITTILALASCQRKNVIIVKHQGFKSQPTHAQIQDSLNIEKI
jgi:hypothetical protein